MEKLTESLNMTSAWNKGQTLSKDMPDYKPELLNLSSYQAKASPSTGGATYQAGVDTTPTSATSGITALQPTSTTQTTLRKVEAQSYDTLYGNFERQDTPFKDVSVSSMTIGELADFSRASGEYGRYVKPRLPKNTYAYKKGLTSTPMGKYQIVGSTLRDLTRRMNLPADTVFNKETQDKMFLFLAKEAVGGGKTSSEKRSRLRGIWEGFKHVDNNTLNKVIAEIEQ